MSYDTLRPKCIAVYGEVQECCLPPGKIQSTFQRYFVCRFIFHLLYLSGADARKCTIHFQDFAIVHTLIVLAKVNLKCLQISGKELDTYAANANDIGVVLSMITYLDPLEGWTATMSIEGWLSSVWQAQMCTV